MKMTVHLVYNTNNIYLQSCMTVFTGCPINMHYKYLRVVFRSIGVVLKSFLVSEHNTYNY